MNNPVIAARVAELNEIFQGIKNDESMTLEERQAKTLTLACQLINANKKNRILQPIICIEG